VDFYPWIRSTLAGHSEIDSWPAFPLPTERAADLEKVSRGSEIQGTLTSLPGRIPTPNHLFHSPDPSAQFFWRGVGASRE
jgi:hypothetical protein